MAHPWHAGARGNRHLRSLLPPAAASPGCCWAAADAARQPDDSWARAAGLQGFRASLLVCNLPGAEATAADALAVATHAYQLVQRFTARRKQRAGQRWQASKEATDMESSQLNCAYAVSQLERWLGRAEVLKHPSNQQGFSRN